MTRQNSYRHAAAKVVQDDQHNRLLAAFEIGERDIVVGRTVPYTPNLLSQIEQEARTYASNNRPTNPDVTDSPHLIK